MFLQLNAQENLIRNHHGIGNQQQRSYSAIINANKIIGNKGETYLKIVYDELGNVWTAYPISNP